MEKRLTTFLKIQAGIIFNQMMEEMSLNLPENAPIGEKMQTSTYSLSHISQRIIVRSTMRP